MNLENIKFERFSLILIVSYVIYALVYIYFGEKVPVNNGFGWDGFIYGNGVRNFPHKLINKEFQLVYVLRICSFAE